MKQLHGVQVLGVRTGEGLRVPPASSRWPGPLVLASDAVNLMSHGFIN